MTRAETIVDGSGVFGVRLEPAGGVSDPGGFTPSPAGGEVTGTLVVEGHEHVQVGVPASCQADTAGGAEGTTCSAAGGLATGVGVRMADGGDITGADAAVAVMVGAVEGVSGGACGTRLVGFKICALWTVDPAAVAAPTFAL